jgi:hypothetical protein
LENNHLGFDEMKSHSVARGTKMLGIIIALLVTGFVSVTDARDKRKPIHIGVNDLGRRRYEYSMKIMTVNSKKIERFNELKPPFGHKRYVRPSQKNKIKQLLTTKDSDGQYEPQHFETPLVFEKINGGGKSAYRVIDGNHRLSAMKSALKELPDDSTISFFAAVYDFNGMDEHDKRKARRDIFKKWNIGIKQSTHDFIEACQDEIPMFTKIAGWDEETSIPSPERMIPCTVYGDIDFKGTNMKSDTMKFKDFVGGYFAGIRGKDKEDGFEGGYSGNAEQFVNDCANNFKEEDVEKISKTWNIICSVWGMKSPYDFKQKKDTDYMPQYITHTSPFYSIMRIILQNEQMTSEELITRLKNTSGINSIIRYWAKFGGREGCKKCHEMLIATLNNGYQKDKQFNPIFKQEKIDDIVELGNKLVKEDIPDVEAIDVEEEKLDDDDKE